MIETEQLDDEEIKVKTESSQGVYEYIFEYYSFTWYLKTKRIDGEEVEVTNDTRISQQVRDALKEEAEDPEKGILDNLNIVSSNRTMLNMKHEDTLAKWGENLARDYFHDMDVDSNGPVKALAEKSNYNEQTICHFCDEEKFCREVNNEYMCCSDCEEENPEEYQLDRENLKRPAYQ